MNGSAGIAVGMATQIPPHNLREVAAAAQWCLEHPDATQEEVLAACMENIKGPDFPNGALIVGYKPDHLPPEVQADTSERGMRRSIRCGP